MSLTITAHHHPVNGANSVKFPRNERANAMAVDLKTLYTTSLAGATNTDEVMAKLRLQPNPRLFVDAVTDHTVRVYLKYEPKNILLITINAH